MPLILPSNTISAGGYEVDNSLRFESSSTDHLSRSKSSSETSTTIGTFSFWVKRCETGATTSIYSNEVENGNNRGLIVITNTDNFYINNSITGQSDRVLSTTQLFTDLSAWSHFVVAFDTNQGTASNRVKIYHNGNQITTFGTAVYPNQSENLKILEGGQTNKELVGKIYGADNSRMYLAEFHHIDGQALTPTDFGEFDENSGIWKPIEYSGTYGNNGFYLDFENSGSLGADVSGNGNNFTVNNLTSDDQMIDTPTNNFCTLNPLFRGGTVGETLEEGNLFYDSNYNKENFVCATQSVSTGKWYFEILPSATDTHGAYGFTNADNLLQTTSLSTSPYDLGIGASIRPDGNGSPDYKINTTSTSISVTTTSVFGIALDADTGDIEFFENNVSVGSGTITGITNYIPFANCHSQSASRKGIATFNFGQDSSFAGSKTRQNNTDNNGQGDFYYAPPSGYYALNTKNLAEYG